VTLTFNESVEDGTLTSGGGAEQLDNGLSISDTLFTSALAVNALSTAQERGVTMTIADNMVTIAWNANVGLLTKGTGDSIRTVTYSSTSLSQTFLQPVGHSELRTSLATLLNSIVNFNGITCSAP
jgi:hypothetical protein